MKRKVIGIAAAVLLAAVGAIALTTYVESAKHKAVADEELVGVYVVSDPIAQSTPAEEVKSSIDLKKVPRASRAEGAITGLDQIGKGLVAAVDLQPGEQLLSSRLVQPGDVTRRQVKPGYQEVTVALDPERAVGGQITAGDTVGIVLSADPFDRDGDGKTKTPNMTHLTFHKVLVTSVQFAQDETAAAPASTSDDENDEDEPKAPTKRLLVTLAVKAPQVEKIVFSAEFGHIWLTDENSKADEAGTRITTLAEVFEMGSAK